MDVKRLFVYLFLVMVMVVGLTACERSLAPANSAPEQDTPSGGVLPEVTGDVMDQIWTFATQTAMAQQGLQPGVGEATAIPILETPAAPAGDQVTPVEPPAPTDAAVPVAQPTEAVPVIQPSPTAPIVVPTATPGLPSSYTLQNGEFPFCIARRFNVNQYDLLSLSGLSLNSQPGAGTALRIPQSSGGFQGNRSLRAHPATYTVGAGESIYSIACMFGDVSPDAIAAANNLAAPYTITAGQQLYIP